MALRYRRLSGLSLVLLIALSLGLRLEARGAARPAGGSCDMPCCGEARQEPSCCQADEPLVSIVDPCGCDAEGGFRLDTTDLRWWIAPQAPAPPPAAPPRRSAGPDDLLPGRLPDPEPRPPRAEPT